MALGGGAFTTQNKILPGSYINFVSAAQASAALSERGYGTLAVELDWGADNEMIELTAADFSKKSVNILGYSYTSDKLKGLRDFFLNAHTLYLYRLNSGTKAAGTYGTAKYSGIRGNDLKVVIQANVNDASKFDVMTYLDTTVRDTQTVTSAGELVDNDFIIWNKDAVLALTAGETLTGGTNGTVTGEAHQKYLDLSEGYSFNTMGCLSTDETVKALYKSFCKRMRDEAGVKFQMALHDMAADYEGVINVKNKTKDEKWPESSLVYWVTGAEAGCAVNKSVSNMKYDGEFTIDTTYTQAQLETAIQSGELVFHRVNPDVRVLTDINSLVTVTEDKGEVFKSNQTMRVIDQIGNDIAVLFNTKYLGRIPNDAAGRISLWSDIVQHHMQLQTIRALEDFSEDNVTVEQGNSKKSVVVADYITVVNTMEQLYMTTVVA